MPGMSGLELVERLRERKLSLPIIFITGHGDIPMAVAAMKMGAIDFIPKPFRDQDLLDRIQQALQQDAERRGVLAEREAIRSRLQDLTPREREVLDKLLEGKANKVIALELELSPRTVELHRARIMDKMGARSLAALVQQVLLTRQ
ncbi:MAG: LuxR C-terminal-related transcriptional regulator [Gammaproteobacteria bacterium]